MKNVIIYNIVGSKKRYPDDLLFRYLRAQIDNSYRLGWNKEDIVIATNFSFSYNGVNSVNLRDVCTSNVFNNKWYGMYELLAEKIVTENFWFRDQDSWQIEGFSFPEFDNYIAGCSYVGTSEWNTASIFVRPEAQLLLEFIRNFLEENSKLNLSTDENYISILRRIQSIGQYFTTLDNQFNVGCTHFEKRFSNVAGPVKVCGFKPHIVSDYEKFDGVNNLNVKLIPSELKKIFFDHKIHYTNHNTDL